MQLQSLLSISYIALAILPVIFPASVSARQNWQIKQLDASGFPAEIVTDRRAMAVDGLPDGRIARAQSVGKSKIRKVWYSRPTTRYQHGILGDTIEGGSLVVVNADGLKIEYLLPKSEVFEDITPRLADLNGDGLIEIITIISNVEKGASLAIFQLNGKNLERRAQSQYIGQAFRWLNIAGIEHYSDSGNLDIAIVVTPHIGGRLDLFRFDGRQLLRIASKQGFSNHVIGSREQRLSANYRSGNGKRTLMALPSANRKELKFMSLESKDLKQLGSVLLPAPVDKAILVTGSGESVKFTVGLSNGNVYSIFQK